MIFTQNWHGGSWFAYLFDFEQTTSPRDKLILDKNRTKAVPVATHSLCHGANIGDFTEIYCHEPRGRKQKYYMQCKCLSKAGGMHDGGGALDNDCSPLLPSSGAFGNHWRGITSISQA